MDENTAFHQNLILSVKGGGVSIMVWCCFAASGPGQLTITDGALLFDQALSSGVQDVSGNI